VKRRLGRNPSLKGPLEWTPYSNGPGERACPVKTQRSIRFRMVNETPRPEEAGERSA
jgi:hypothetical protein